MKNILYLLIMTSLLVACNKQQNSQEPIFPEVGSPHEVRPLVLSEEGKKIIHNQNEYAIELLRLMAKNEQKNIFVSPLSASFVCAMLANGAQGETGEQILKAIRCEDYSLETINAHYLQLLRNLPYQDSLSFIGLANALYVDQSFPLETTYAEKIRANYLAEVSGLNFMEPASYDIINHWASEHTEGMIKKVIDEKTPLEEMRLVMLNALCFCSRWQNEFQSNSTYQTRFYSPEGEIPVRMMHNSHLRDAIATGSFSFNKGEVVEHGARVLRMYYQSKGYCMDVVLPEPEVPLDAVLDTLSCDWIDRMLASGQQGVDVYFPKFKLKEQYKLIPYMEALGMKLAFTPGADFSGISHEESIYVSMLKQDTYLEVNEKGVKAAAVTTGFGDLASSEPLDPFFCDHPFAFFIRDVRNGIVIFAGIITHPEGEKN